MQLCIKQPTHGCSSYIQTPQIRTCPCLHLGQCQSLSEHPQTWATPAPPLLSNTLNSSVLCIQRTQTFKSPTLYSPSCKDLAEKQTSARSENHVYEQMTEDWAIKLLKRSSKITSTQDQLQPLHILSIKLMNVQCRHLNSNNHVGLSLFQSLFQSYTVASTALLLNKPHVFPLCARVWHRLHSCDSADSLCCSVECALFILQQTDTEAAKSLLTPSPFPSDLAPCKTIIRGVMSP